MAPQYKCKLGGDTERPQYAHSKQECVCNASCEPHIHEENDNILCMHDGENDHSHCKDVDAIIG